MYIALVWVARPIAARRLHLADQQSLRGKLRADNAHDLAGTVSSSTNLLATVRGSDPPTFEGFRKTESAISQVAVAEISHDVRLGK
jgi:hypothetical protein